MFEFRLPDVGEGVAEGELVAWHVEPGDEVAEDDVLAEVETDKAVVDLPSPVAGTVAELHAAEGEVVPVGEVLVTIDPADDADANVEDATEAPADASEGDGDAAAGSEGSSPKPAIVERSSEQASETDGETSAAGEAEAAPSEGEPSEGEPPAGAEAPTAGSRIFAPPHVRRLARELGIDVGEVAGSGPGGRVSAADVRDAAGASGAADEDVADAITEVAPETDVGGAESTPAGGADDVDSGQSSTTGRKSAIRRVGGDDASAGAATSSSATATGGAEGADREQTLAAPATRRLADELDVDLDDVPTEKTRDGEAYVEREDIRAYADARSAAQVADAAAMAEAGGAAAADDAAEPGAGASGPSDQPGPDERETREPYRGVRRTIGEQMERAAATVPHATHHDRAVVSALVDAREAMRSRAEEQGVRLTYLPFVLKAVVAGLRQHPVVNTSLDEEREEIVYKHHYDVGVATATDAGLLVPVVRDVDEKGIFELAAAVTDLTERARDRSISREEMQGGTFTVTNFGAIGGEYATPIVNHPETAILGLGAIEQRPVVVDGEVEARHTLPLSLSIDHRVIDGAEAAQFANTVVEYLETPSLSLLE